MATDLHCATSKLHSEVQKLFSYPTLALSNRAFQMRRLDGSGNTKSRSQLQVLVKEWAVTVPLCCPAISHGDDFRWDVSRATPVFQSHNTNINDNRDCPSRPTVRSIDILSAFQSRRHSTFARLRPVSPVSVVPRLVMPSADVLDAQYVTHRCQTLSIQTLRRLTVSRIFSILSSWFLSFCAAAAFVQIRT